MKVQVIQINTREGVSKKTDNEYRVDVLWGLVPIVPSQNVITSDANVFKQHGFKVMESNIDSDMYDALENHLNLGNDLPFFVELTMVEDVRDNKLVMVVEQLDILSSDIASETPDY